MAGSDNPAGPSRSADTPQPASRTSSAVQWSKATMASTGTARTTAALKSSLASAPIPSGSAPSSGTSTPASSSIRYPVRPTNFFTKSLTAAAATSTASSSVNIRGSAFGSQVATPTRTSSLQNAGSEAEVWDTAVDVTSLPHVTLDSVTSDDGSHGPDRSGLGLFASSRNDGATGADQDRVDSLGSFYIPIGQQDGVNEFGQKVRGAVPRDALGFIRSVSHRAEIRAPSAQRSRPSSELGKLSAPISRASSPHPTDRAVIDSVGPVALDSNKSDNIAEAGEDMATAQTEKPASGTSDEKLCASRPGLDDVAPDGHSEPYPDRKYYILSSAGKPVFISHLASRQRRRDRGASPDSSPTDEEEERRLQQEREDEEEEAATTQVGVMQALISIFADEDGDRLRYINADNSQTRITFLLRSPLYLVCVSSWGEPPATTRSHLENLYLQVLSLVSAGQLSRLFARMPNFDLRRLLEGTDVLLGSLLSRLQTDMCFLLEALQPVRIEAPLRDALSTLLLPPKGEARPRDLLYVLVLANERILTLLRPKKHSVHPADMHLLVNTVYGTEALREPGGESWIPVCLPKFAPQGFVHAYVSFLDRDYGRSGPSRTREDTPSGTSTPRSDRSRQDTVALVMVTGNRDGFAELSAWRSSIVDALAAPSKAFRPSLLHRLFEAVESSDYSADELGVPGLRHFIYKSRQNVQITASRLEAPYQAGNEDHKRLVTLYSLAHDAIHGLSTGASVPLPGGTRSSTDLAFEYLGRQGSSAASSDAGTNPSSFVSKMMGGAVPATATGSAQSRLPPIPGPVKMQYYQTDKEAVLGWITQPFELYMTFNPWLSKTAIVSAANAVAKWVKSNEGSVFITSGLTF